MAHSTISVVTHIILVRVDLLPYQISLISTGVRSNTSIVRCQVLGYTAVFPDSSGISCTADIRRKRCVAATKAGHRRPTDLSNERRRMITVDRCINNSAGETQCAESFLPLLGIAASI